jgi:hypothetical protein
MSRPQKALPSGAIAGANVALATLASTVASILGQPGVAWPICGMIGAVYGVTGIVDRIKKQS